MASGFVSCTQTPNTWLPAVSIKADIGQTDPQHARTRLLLLRAHAEHPHQHIQCNPQIANVVWP